MCDYGCPAPECEEYREKCAREARREALEEAASLFSCWQPGVKDCQCGGCLFPKTIRALASESGEK